MGENGTFYTRDHELTHFFGDQTMQMHGQFEVFPLNSALFGLVI